MIQLVCSNEWGAADDASEGSYKIGVVPRAFVPNFLAFLAFLAFQISCCFSVISVLSTVFSIGRPTLV